MQLTSGLDSAIENGQVNHQTSINPSHTDIKSITSILEPEQKLLIDLAFFKGYTYSEIAEELNIPLGTVKTRIRKAINVLRSIYNYNQSATMSA